ncbi:MORN repeat-containing protein [Marinobacter alexandrii]|uniref:MORN repeat-containing protein n=1 Tax=Marinobacter alexandrii TaxID=2570351 RepID=UPI002ABDDCDF|nr:PEGA domain-containing protein [Marinobacter alexandrii]
MVDFRPLLFINALALMLLVTAGFASVHDEINSGTTLTPPTVSQTLAANAPPAKTKTESRTLDKTTQTAKTATALTSKPKADPAPVEAETFHVPPMPEDPTLLALAESPAALATRPDFSPDQPEPAPATGSLVLRSNVVGDQVTINGKGYGATRLDLDLEPGTYDVTITKPGYQAWSQKVALAANSEMTLVGELIAYTTVNFKNGTWIGGVKTGDGTYQNKDGLRYEGHFVNGKFHGQGTAWHPDGSRYDGDWKNGQHHGQGTWRSAEGARYAGEFRANQFSGKGTLTMANGDILTGHWTDGQLNGHGSLTTADGMLYVGAFRDDEFHGRGSLTYPDGRHYEGEFSNGAFHGSGAEVFSDGKKYEGEYIEGKFHGQGLLLNPNGSSIEATFRHGKPYGQVRLTTAAGEIFTARTTEPGVCYRDKSYRATQCPTLDGW